MNFKTSKLLGAAALASLLIALPALGQDAEVAEEVVETLSEGVSADVVFILNSFLMIFGGVLVMWMAAGFAMLEAGLVRTKNVSMQLLKNISLFAIAAIFYYLIGYNLMYPLGNWTIGSDDTGGYLGAFGIGILEAVGITADDADDFGYAATSSDFFFQVMFCATTASIVSGTLAERIKILPFLIFTVVLTALIYPIQASWKWGGGFLDAMGFLDFAGSTVVHSVGGWAALAGAILLGARIGKYNPDGTVNAMPGSSMPLATLGTFILWMGWFGFNGASQLAMGSVGDVADVGRIMANTNAGAAGGAVAALILTAIIYKKVDLTFVLNGALAGLVSVTAEPLTPGLGTASLIGAVGGVIVVFAVPLLDRLKIDDVVGAIPVHLLAGIWGTIAVIFTNADANLGVQLLSIVVVGIFTFVASFVVWLILKATMGLRPSEDDEALGLDKAEVGVEAYPEFR
ncbi:ammonium transporter [Pelagibacterium halotolerans]|uniref:Ammonium transporter n=1 Tax=Pelagibacterium halotolerans (strain DSM 22347 / JCM 15775 / CGMCC 1.7692 / B2) TaxID=1082931 RepID=G4R7P1_PELHB|nr:ammonium transporter [Pelagibacterium halotolerans]AEQ53301.1 Ammonium transporter [Pelagibacterium halotolerans B2]QJR17083.1 ammonium transporter [Pelagibacterium halotolerans]SEA63451.1 ammonium transporter [Pelagibacterium halotolerans]